jgi:peptidoglycan/LPS O-acetylase OafA/YrhL
MRPIGVLMAAMSSTPAAESSHRLAEVDALRGVAALAVVLFHFTTRFIELYPPTGSTAGSPSFTVPHGHYGVNLFFIISGFVIFMTLARTQRGMDFVVSRFSRLFPAYWVAVAMTFAVTSTFGLPGKEVTVLQALANLFMIHGLFYVPHVDGVYWTLEVELLFYSGMFLLFVRGQLHRVYWAMAGLLAMRLVYHVAHVAWGVDLPWTLYRLTILKFIPWFALGIFVYQTAINASRAGDRSAQVTAVLSLACLWVVDGWPTALLALALAGLVWGAASGRLPWLGNPVLGFFGTISYTLYLLHENIGWVVMRAVQAQGGSFDASIAVAFLTTVLLATALTYAVEKPAMRWVRKRYHQRLASP